MDLFNKYAVDERTAIFSPCNKYRYVLTRRWDSRLPMALLIGLNPSDATDTKNDPTITRIVDLLRYQEYGGFYMMNLFAYKTPYPGNLKTAGDLQGENDKYIAEYASKASKVIFCWGAFGVMSMYDVFLNRVLLMIEKFPDARCFGYTAAGHPRHPLFLKKRTPLVKFKKNNYDNNN